MNPLALCMHACIKKEGRLENKKFFKLKNKGYRDGIRASVDALSRDGPGQISRERVQRGRLTRQGTTS